MLPQECITIWNNNRPETGSHPDGALKDNLQSAFASFLIRQHEKTRPFEVDSMGVPREEPKTSEETQDRVAYDTTLRQMRIFQECPEGMQRMHETRLGPDSDVMLICFRTAKRSKGKQLAMALQALYENDVFAKEGITYRNDYAPKGRELEALEALLSKMRR